MVDSVWGYTPRQADAYLALAAMRKKKMAALELSISASGSRGNPSEVKKQIKDWSKGEP